MLYAFVKVWRDALITYKRIKVSIKLDVNKTESLFVQTILGKIFGTKFRNPVKCDGRRKV